MSLSIVHISDTHLGFTDLDKIGDEGINCREMDFYKSFAFIVDRVLEIRPFAVVHSGDFFHRPSPANRPLVEGLKQLKRLSDENIPFIVIAGNHSTPRTIYTSPILKALESINNVYPIFQQVYSTLKIGDITFHGLPHINDEEKFLNEIAKIDPVKGMINILMLHTSVGKDYIMEEYGEKIFPRENINLLKEFQYTALGHWHNHQQIKKIDNAWYSGSTERLSDTEAGKEKGFLLVEISEKEKLKVDFHEVPARPWFRLNIEKCSEKTFSEIQNIIKDYSGKIDSSDAIVSVYFYDIKPTQSVELSNSWMLEQFPGALSVLPRRIFHSARSGLKDTDFKSLSLEHLFNDFMKESAEKESEYNEMIQLSKKYFENYERGE